MEEKRAVLAWTSGNNYSAQTSYGSLDVGEDYHRPMELLLVSLGGCMGVDVSTILRKKRQKVEDIRIEVIGYRRDDFPRIYERIRIVCRVKGEGLSEKAVQDAVRLAVEKYCSVYAMLSKSAQIDVEIRLWEEKD